MAEKHSHSEGLFPKCNGVMILPNGNDTPAIKLSGKWLREAGFETGTGVTVKIAGDCIVLIPDNPQEQALRKEIYQIKQVVNGIQDGMFSVLNDS